MGHGSRQSPLRPMTVRGWPVCLTPVRPGKHHLSDAAVHSMVLGDCQALLSDFWHYSCPVLAQADILHTHAEVAIVLLQLKINKIVFLLTHCDPLLMQVYWWVCNMIALNAGDSGVCKSNKFYYCNLRPLSYLQITMPKWISWYILVLFMDAKIKRI